MSFLKPWMLSWTNPADMSDVKNIRVRFSETPFTGTAADYALPYAEVGLVTSVALPLPNTPAFNGNINIGISTVDAVGNESDMDIVTAPFDTVAPPPVTGAKLA